MENPMYWTVLERTIYQAIQDHHAAQEKGLIGYSLPARIAIALKEKNLIDLSKLEKIQEDS